MYYLVSKTNYAVALFIASLLLLFNMGIISCCCYRGIYLVDISACNLNSLPVDPDCKEFTL